jgi:hypothetical protein
LPATVLPLSRKRANTGVLDATALSKPTWVKTLSSAEITTPALETFSKRTFLPHRLSL